MVIYFHHTDAESVVKIQESKVLKKAEGRFGTGVYLTKMGPDTALKKLLVNNYDDNVSKDEMKKLIAKRGKKAEVCISIDVPEDFVTEFVEKCNAGERDVYIFKGDINLSEMDKVELFYRE